LTNHIDFLLMNSAASVSVDVVHWLRAEFSECR